MPYVRMTVTISAGYHADDTGSVEEVCVAQEAAMRDAVRAVDGGIAHPLRRLLAFAKGPGGIITWDCKPSKAPKEEIPNASS